MAIADTITSMQTHTSNAYTMIGYGTDLTGTNKNLENLSTSIFNAFLEALRNPDTLFTNLPKKSGSGANITLNDTANAPMRIFPYPSELTQATTTGKNLFNNNFSDYTRPNDYRICPINLEIGQTYSLSSTLVGTQMTGVVVGVVPFGERYSDFSSNLTLTIASNGNTITRTITPDNTWTSPKLVIYASDETTFNSIFENYEVQLEKGAATSYEPFTYGASPNPNYPQDIHTISGSNKVVVCGKNLAYTGWAEDFVSRINDSTKAKLEVVDGRKCLFFTASAGYQEYDTKYLFKINWKENTQYTFRFTIKPSVNDTYNLSIEYTDGTIQRIDSTTASNTWSSYNKFTSYANKTIKSIHAYWSSGNCYIDLDTFMVYEGTEELDYEPYQEQLAQVNLGDLEYCKIGNYEDKFIRTSGKNLFDIKPLLIDAGATYTENADGSITFSPKTSMFTTGYTLDTPLELPISISYKITNGTGTNLRFRLWYDDGSVANLSGGSGTGTTEQTITQANITKSGTTKVTKIGFDFSTSGTFTIKELMVNKGTTALPYEPYGSNEWYIKKNIGKVVFDGSEAWASAGEGDTTNGVSIYTSIETAISSSTKELISDNFRFVPRSSVTSTTLNFITGGGSKAIVLNIDKTLLSEATLNGFKTWLSTHNTIVNYPLATPTYTQITGTLAEQLENVYQKLLSYTGQTNISQINNDLSFELSVSAIEDL